MEGGFPSGVDWGRLVVDGTAYAEARGRVFGLALGGARAKEIAMDAVRQIFASGWDQVAYPTIEECLGSRINGLVLNLSRKKSTRGEVSNDDAIARAQLADRRVDDVVADRQLAGRLMTLMLARLEDNDNATSVLLAMAEGLDRPADIAEATGLPVKKVYKARERIREVASEVKRTTEKGLGT